MTKFKLWYLKKKLGLRTNKSVYEWYLGKLCIKHYIKDVKYRTKRKMICDLIAKECTN